jgi:hypothetical protein
LPRTTQPGCRRIFDQHLTSARPFDRFIAKAHAQRPQCVQCGVEIVVLNDDAVPATGDRFRAIRHRLCGRGTRTAKPELQIATFNNRKRWPPPISEREAQRLVERQRRINVVDKVANDGHAYILSIFGVQTCLAGRTRTILPEWPAGSNRTAVTRHRNRFFPGCRARLHMLHT